MPIKLGALDMFRNASAWADSTKLNLDGQGAVGNAGNYGGFLSARNRRQPEKEANNAVRTALLQALARTFDLKTNPAGDGTRFSQDFMRKLEKRLGSAFKREDFKIGDDGTVSSGRPLTARRIKAILRSAEDTANAERYNEPIMKGFMTDISSLPEESGFRNVWYDAYDEVHDRFGDLGVPELHELHKLVPAPAIEARFRELGKKRVTPEAMRGWYTKLAIDQGAKLLMKRKTQQIVSQSSQRAGLPMDDEEASRNAFDGHAQRFAEERASAFENVARDRNRDEIPPVKDHVRENLGKARLNPIYAQALVAAARELGREESAEDVLALFDESRPAGDALRAELDRFDGELDSETLKALALDVLRRD